MTAFGVITCIFGVVMILVILILLAFNIKYWKQQTFKIHIIKRRMFLRRRWLALKMEGVTDERKTEFWHLMEQEVIKLVKKEQSWNFLSIYWNLSIKYNHSLVWLIQLIFCLKKKKKQRGETDFELLKPLSRFYHFINCWTLLLIWWLANFLIAIYWEISKQSSIPIYYAILIVVLTAFIGNIAIMISIRALYAVYIKNITDAFETGNKLKPPKFHPKLKKKQALERQATNDFE